VQQRAQFVEIVFSFARLAWFEVEVPVLLNVETTRRESQVMSRRQLVNVAEDGDWIGNVAEREIRVERFEIDLALHVRMLEQRLDLGAEDERAAVRDRVVDRLLADAVARDEDLAFFVVPNREGKHAAQ